MHNGARACAAQRAASLAADWRQLDSVRAALSRTSSLMELAHGQPSASECTPLLCNRAWWHRGPDRHPRDCCHYRQRRGGACALQIAASSRSRTGPTAQAAPRRRLAPTMRARRQQPARQAAADWQRRPHSPRWAERARRGRRPRALGSRRARRVRRAGSPGERLARDGSARARARRTQSPRAPRSCASAQTT